MQIVSQFVASSNSLAPAYLLAAPQPRLALPEPTRPKLLAAPQIAGLLPAPAPRFNLSQLKLVIDRSSPSPITLSTPRCYRTLAELDAELAPLVARVADDFRRLRDFYAQQQAVGQ
jgi:hypothetical protein